MKIPDLLEFAIDEEVKKYSIKDLKDIALKLSKRYMESKRTGETLLKNELDMVAYSVIRMPATYSAIRTSMEKVLEMCDLKIDSVLDIGSGTGAAEWVVSDLLDVEDIVCLEREKTMRDISRKYFSYHDILKNVKFIESDILKENLSVKKDLSIMSYIINELDEKDRLIAIQKVLDATNKLLLIVEPGTPEGFNNIKMIKEYAQEKGFCVLAPCTGNCRGCNLPEDDWCASSVRVQRSKIHKYLKDAEVGFEDEKFTYIAISKEKIENLKDGYRILRHPKIENGRVTIKVCKNGEISEKIITKKDKELFKTVKKKNIGDFVNI